jgi:serine/threonine protein phosphatase PrpC
MNLCSVPLPSSSDFVRDKLPCKSALSVHDDNNSIVPSFPQIRTEGMQSLHFFGVYDGHAGDHVSQQCSKHLHQHLRAAIKDGMMPPRRQLSHRFPSFKGETSSLTSVESDIDNPYSPPYTPTSTHGADNLDSAEEGFWSSTQGQSHLTSSSGTHIAQTHAPLHDILDRALLRAFLAVDQELGQSSQDTSLTGSTATVALVGISHIWVANCGGCCCSGSQHARLLLLHDACMH